MSDGTSCGIFAELFHRLEEDGITARWLFELSSQYDFTPISMGVNEILAKHDLVRIDWNEQHEHWELVYHGDNGFDDAEKYCKQWMNLPPPTPRVSYE